MTLVLIGLLTVFSIHVANEWLESWRVDLTGGDLYSLTDGTHAILDRMQEEGVKPLDIRLYFSETAGKTLPKFVKDFIGYERYLRSLLGEYERAAAGRFGSRRSTRFPTATTRTVPPRTVWTAS